MRILLTGATGFLGYRTLERLILDEKVTHIVASGRSIRKTHFVDHPKVDYVLGDLTNAIYVDAITKDIDQIIHAAALSSPWGTPETFRKANVRPQELLIAAAQKKNIQRFIYVSTPSMYFEPKDAFDIKESDPLPKKFINQYAATKREAEILLEKSGIPFLAIRPRALTGRGDTVIMPRLIRAFEEGRLKIIGSGKNTADLTSVSNVVDALVLCMYAEAKALNQVYNISNGAPVVLWDAIADVLTKLGHTPPQKKVPYPVVKLIARMMELKSKWTNGKEPALTVYGVGTLSKSFTMNIDKAKELLGYSPNTTTEEAINEFVAWYQTK